MLMKSRRSNQIKGIKKWSGLELSALVLWA
jgi:hypothetical protein